MADIIDGRAIAQKIRDEVKKEVEIFKTRYGFPPGLATILAGSNPASQVYVRNKNRACIEAGMKSHHQSLDENILEKDLSGLINQLNTDDTIHGILVQLPLPKHISTSGIIEKISPAKDVDGFHPVNAGYLVAGAPGLRPCTPSGVMRLIESTGVDLKGKKAVVIGRSNIVGKPVALMLIAEHATVTVCHSHTKDLPEIVSSADVLISAIGSPKFVKGEWIKEGAVVIDVGITRLPDGRLSGDVDFDSALKRASFITPVPGGVGPMTIAMLLWNTLKAAKKATGYLTENAQTNTVI